LTYISHFYVNLILTSSLLLILILTVITLLLLMNYNQFLWLV